MYLHWFDTPLEDVPGPRARFPGFRRVLGYKPDASFRAGVSEQSVDWSHQELGRNVGSKVPLRVLPLSVLAFLRGGRELPLSLAESF